MFTFYLPSMLRGWFWTTTARLCVTLAVSVSWKCWLLAGSSSRQLGPGDRAVLLIRPSAGQGRRLRLRQDRRGFRGFHDRCTARSTHVANPRRRPCTATASSDRDKRSNHRPRRSCVQNDGRDGRVRSLFPDRDSSTGPKQIPSCRLVPWLYGDSRGSYRNLPP